MKKSSVMVFDVGASVDAEAAADLPQSEFEAMEQNMDEMLDAVLKNAQMVEIYKTKAEEYADDAKHFAEQAEETVVLAQNISFDVTQQVNGIDQEVQTVSNTVATLDTAVLGIQDALEDMRTAYSGAVYATPGDAVRSQAGEAMMEIGMLGSRVTALEEDGITVDSALNSDSTNPIQNKVVALNVNSINTRLNQISLQSSKVAALEAKLNQLWTTTHNYINAHS